VVLVQDLQDLPLLQVQGLHQGPQLPPQVVAAVAEWVA